MSKIGKYMLPLKLRIKYAFNVLTMAKDSFKNYEAILKALNELNSGTNPNYQNNTNNLK